MAYTSAKFSENLKYRIEIIKNKFYFGTIVDLNKPPANTSDVLYFSIDDELTYSNYYYDFGPLNLSCVYKYCHRLYNYLESVGASKRIVHYTTMDPEKRTNSAFLIGAYAVIYLKTTPREIFKIMTSNGMPPYKPYLDASQNGSSGYTIRLIDCLQGIHRAAVLGFFDFSDFDVDEYDLYSCLLNGDLNWLLPRKFIAFIGPIDSGHFNCHPASFYIDYFLENDVRTVIRLNNKVYNAKVFPEAGIEHYEMFFTDGSTPPKEILQEFLALAESKKGAIAVHCKAGLGRTGSLIGAYIMKHFRMTARETIAWLRICRPGSVIGQQQGWLEKIEKWLWRQGSIYSLKHYGEGDKIPHYRYGVYSIKWKEHKETLRQQKLRDDYRLQCKLMQNTKPSSSITKRYVIGPSSPPQNSSLESRRSKVKQFINNKVQVGLLYNRQLGGAANTSLGASNANADSDYYSTPRFKHKVSRNVKQSNDDYADESPTKSANTDRDKYGKYTPVNYYPNETPKSAGTEREKLNKYKEPNVNVKSRYSINEATVSRRANKFEELPQKFKFDKNEERARRNDIETNKRFGARGRMSSANAPSKHTEIKTQGDKLNEIKMNRISASAKY